VTRLYCKRRGRRFAALLSNLYGEAFMALRTFFVVAVKNGRTVSADVQAYSRLDVETTLINNGYSVVEISEE